MIIVIENEDGTLSGLRQFVTTKSHLKMMKNLFLYYVKSPFHSWHIYIFFLTFGYIEKRLDKKAEVNFKIYGVTYWTTNNCNTHIAQYLRK